MLTEVRNQPRVAAPARTAAVPGRLMAVDALRGFDMFWIIGAEGLFEALRRMHPNFLTRTIATQLEHAAWEGMRFEDLIFPLFVFLVGLSTVFSLSKAIEVGGRSEALKRVLRRGILLFAIGILYSGGFSDTWPRIRLMGVLNRIALAYFFGSLLFCYFKPRALIGICVGLLVGYWALMALVPIRDIQITRAGFEAAAQKRHQPMAAELFAEDGWTNPSRVKNSRAWAAAEGLYYSTNERVTGKYDKGLNLANHLDFEYLPGSKYSETADGFFDPEGYLSTIPAVATCLLGIFAGLFLKQSSSLANGKLAKSGRVLALVGATMVAAELILHIWSAPLTPAAVYGFVLLVTFVFAMWVLRVSRQADGFKYNEAIVLVGAGAVSLALGYFWASHRLAPLGVEFPVIKKIWTSSYVLVAGGYSAILLGLFYLVVEVWQWRKWCQPFVWIGMNSITIYLAQNILGNGGFGRIARRFVGGDIQNFFDEKVAGLGELIVSIAGLALAFWFVHFLYRRRIFLRL